MCGFCNVGVCVGFLMCGCVYVWVLQCVGVCMCGFCNVWVCGCFDNCVGVLVIYVLVFTVFYNIYAVFLYCFIYVRLFLFVLSVLV